MTQSRSFLRHAAVYGLGSLLLRSASVIMTPLYTRYLPPSEYGVLEVIDKIGNIFAIVLMANGIRVAAITFYCQATDEKEREQTAATTTTALVVILALSALLVLPFIGHVGDFLGIDDPALVTFGIATVLLDALTVIPFGLMQARLESGFSVASSLAMFFSRFALTFLGVAVLGWGVWGVWGANALISTVFGVVLTLREFLRGSFHPDFQKVREVLKFSLPFIPGGLFLFVLHNGDRLFLPRYVGLEGVGLYALGYKLGSAASMFGAAPLHMVWGARMYDEYKTPHAARTVGRVITWILAAYLLVGVPVSILEDELIWLLGWGRYEGAGMVVSVVVLAYFFLYASNLMDSTFYVFHKTSLKPWVAAISMAITLAFYAWLIPRYGIMGAAYATLGGFVCQAAVTYLFTQRVFRVSYEPGRLLGMLGLAFLLVMLSRFWGSSPGEIALKIGLSVAWPGLIWVSGLMTDDEKAEVLALLRHLVVRFRTAMPVPRFGKGDT